MVHPLLPRRSFLKLATLATGSSFLPAFASSPAAVPRFPDKDPSWLTTWNSALTTLAGNIRVLPRYDQPVLIEGSTYTGIWMECGPNEALVYASLSRYVPAVEGKPAPLQIARNGHMAFFALQRPDGQIPSAIKSTDVGFGQIQMVVPIAATAWDTFEMGGRKDEELLTTAYAACSRWDAWLRQYRDTRKTGLVEGFCTYDTGHDNSPRWAGIPNRCPDSDARKFPPLPGMPRICPDLSATVYGARVALAKMAEALNKHDEAARWKEDAEKIRRLIIEKLYDAQDGAFYDLDTDNKFIRVRGDLMSRVLGEHVLDLSQPGDKAIFEAVWTWQIHNPKAFWGPYPLSSIAMDDPAFVRPIPRNSWGGASQALTALRAPRWMMHYGKQAEMRFMMQQWCEAIRRHGEFRQQIDPLTGVFTQPDPGGYSPCALVYLDFAARLGAAHAAPSHAHPPA